MKSMGNWRSHSAELTWAFAFSTLLSLVIAHTGTAAQPSSPNIVRPPRDFLDYLSSIGPLATLVGAVVAAIITIGWGVRNLRLTYFTKEWTTLMQFILTQTKFMDPALTNDYKKSFTGDDAIKYEIIARLCIGYLDDVYFLGSKKLVGSWLRGSVKLLAGTHLQWLKDHSDSYDEGFYKFIIGRLNWVRKMPPAPPLINSDELHQHSRWFLFLGIVLITLGVIALLFDVLATVASVLVFGWLLVIAGIVEIVHGFQTHRWGGFFVHLLGGLLYLVAGVLFIVNPLAAALSLTLFLGAFFLLGGIFDIVGALRLRAPHLGWGVLSGAITAVLGLLLWTRWPASGLWFIGIAVGIGMIFRGWAWAMLGTVARGVGQAIGKAHA